MTRRQPLVAALVGLGVIVVMIAALILPKAAAVRSKQADVEKARQQEQALGVQLEQLKQDAKDAGEAHRQLETLDTELPSVADLPGIIRSLNSTALGAGVDFMSIAPSAPQPATAGSVSTIPVQITVNGDYFALDQFLYRLETLPRIVNVGSLTVSPLGTASSGQSSSGSSASSAAQTGASQLGQGLQAAISATFFTTDTSAGPGSVPGSTQSTGSASSTGAAPATSTSTGA